MRTGTSDRSWLRRQSATVLPAVLCLGLVPGGSAQAQIPGLGSAAPASEITAPADPFGRDTPRGLVAGLVAALAAADRGRIVEYLTPPDDVFLTATQIGGIHEALDRAGDLTPPADLSLVPEGTSDDGLSPDDERVGTLATADGPIPLVAHRFDINTRVGNVWRLDADTTDVLLAFDVRTAPAETLPVTLLGTLPEGPRLAGAAIRDWLALAALALLGYGVAWSLTGLRHLVGGRIARDRGPSRLTRFVDVSGPPLRLGLSAAFFTWGAGLLGVSVVARYQLGWIANLAIWLAVAWFLWRAIDALAGAVLEGMSRRGAVTAYSAVAFFTRVAKVLLVLLFGAVALRTLGVDITAGLAALGVGGLALAFGAQKSMENLIGSVTLIADRPVRVGDFCRFGETLGTVEEIGIRSTRIRTLGRTIVTVPNGEFSNLHLENFTHRDEYLFKHDVGLIYATDPRTMRAILAAFRQILTDHPRVTADPARVRLVRLGAWSKDVEIFAYVRAADWNEFLEIQEGLILAIMDIVEDSASGFAFPSRTIHVEREAA